MSQNPEDDDAGEQPESHDDTSRAIENNAQNYQVGYRKPPAEMQFKKGKSGNPNGRPRKPKQKKSSLADAPKDMYLDEEVSRPVTVRQGGKTYTLTALQALMRAMIAQGLAGKRLPAQFIIEAAREEKERQRKSDEEFYANLTILKRHGLQVIEECKRKNTPVPRDLLPHPDDIVLGPGLKAEVVGPMDIVDLLHYEHAAAMRDHCLLRHICFWMAWQTFKPPKQEMGVLYLFIAQRIDAQLPLRMRWPSDERPHFLARQYSKYSLRECAQQVDTEWAHLKATRPSNDGALTQIAVQFEACLDLLFSKLWPSVRDHVEQRYAKKKRIKPAE
jgi:hypothetical protein